MYLDLKKKKHNIQDKALTESQNKCHTGYGEEGLDSGPNCIGCDRCFNCNHKICVCIYLEV